MSTRAPAFTLTKWYLDCTDADGRVAIVYWASLTWHGLALTWQGLSVTENGCEPIHRSTLAAGGMPAREGDRILWRSAGLECELVAHVHDQPIAVRLFESEGGFVDWRCEAPAALVTLDLAGSSTLRGPGYAERLELTIPPWRLPITELRWGRWMDDAAARSVIWIDWRGAAPRTWVFVNGVPFTDAAVSDDRVSVGDATLVLTCRSALSSRAADEIIDAIPGLRALIPVSVLTPREMKWSSRGILQRVGVVPIEGRAIHELVAFR